MAEKSNKKEIEASIGRALFSDVERFEFFFAEKWKKIAFFSVLAAVIVAVCFGVISAKRSRDKVIAFGFASAATVEELKSALAENGSHRTAPAARYRLAMLYMKDGKKAEAVAELRQIGADADAMLRGKSALVTAYLLEESGKFAEAAEAFAAASKDADYTLQMRVEAAYSAARLLVAQGSKEESAALLRDALQLNVDPSNYWYVLSKSLLQAIENGDAVSAAK
jgi:tetratricopeptide (TPR) repeat protein